MPIPLAAAAALAAGAGSAVNSATSLLTNRSQQRFSRRMYDLQKNDNLAFWHLQNEYNSPQAQMERFRAAGLNPNLVYGQSSGAASGQAQQVQTPDVQNVQFRDPQFGNAISSAGLAYLSAITDIEIKQAQVDNLRAQNKVIQEDAQLKAAYRSRSQFDLGFESELRDVSADSRRERLRQLKTGTDISVREDIRRALQSTTSVQEAAERIATMRQQQLNMQQQRAQSKVEISRIHADKRRIDEQIVQMRKDGTLKDLEADLRRDGINPNDPMWARILGRVLEDAFGDGETPSLLDLFTKSKFK